MNQQPMTRREARELERQRERSGNTGSVPVVSESTDEFNPISGPVGILEPKSLLVEAPSEMLENISIVLPDSGSILTTGAIELPWLKPHDEEEAVVTAAAAEADTAANQEILENEISGIDPIPARTYERSRRKASVFPNRLRKGWGVVHLVLVSAFIMFALLSALVACVLLGVIKF